jgi:hypothetical protein
VSYRRKTADSGNRNRPLELKGRFGKENIFFDGGTLQPGMQFLEEIQSYRAHIAGAFILLIGPKWMTTMLSRWQRGEEDYVAKEIEFALRNSWTVIPVLLNDAEAPDPLTLPPSLRALRHCQAERLRQMCLDDDIHHLIARLDEIRASMAEKLAAPASPGPEVLPADIMLGAPARKCHPFTCT